jgi:hypothetical protein
MTLLERWRNLQPNSRAVIIVLSAGAFWGAAILLVEPKHWRKGIRFRSCHLKLGAAHFPRELWRCRDRLCRGKNRYN